MTGPTTFKVLVPYFFQLDNGTRIDLENAKYIPDFKRNLISLGTFESLGYVISLKGGRVKVIKGSMVVMIHLLKCSRKLPKQRKLHEWRTILIEVQWEA